MADDILNKIVERRCADIERLGFAYGVDIPKVRRVGHAEFLGVPGAILEVKRASPSKGDIAPDLNSVALATTYADAGAQGISVLTEENFFKGSLRDLIAVADAMSIGDESLGSARKKRCAVLRKDFLLFEEEVDVAYRCGADAVLLIARILGDEQLFKMAVRAKHFDLQAFVEVREKDDLRKLDMLLEKLPDAQRTVVAGVNSRDLVTFHTDALVPAALRNKLPTKAVFESGVHNAADAAFARSLGFTGILVGEAVAKNPPLAKELVKSFGEQKENRRGIFWKEIAERRYSRVSKTLRPLIKICGITEVDDGLAAVRLGADLLGFMFAESPRKTNEDFVRNFYSLIKREFICNEDDGNRKRPLLVGVITDPNSVEGKTAIRLAKEGILDAVQFHGIATPAFNESKNDFGCYQVERISEASDFAIVDASATAGEPRILLDAKVEGVLGGSGKRIPEEVLEAKSREFPLWLAGGITPQNVSQIISKFAPELIDVSSGVEDRPGKKSLAKMKELFRAVDVIKSSLN